MLIVLRQRLSVVTSAARFEGQLTLGKPAALVYEVAKTEGFQRSF